MKDFGHIFFNDESNRWVFSNNDNCYDLHCGAEIDIFLLNRYRSCSLELDGDKDWYIIFKDTSFNLRRNKIYKAKF